MAAAAEEVAHIAAIAEKNARKCDPICADDLEPLEPHLGFAAAHSAAGKIHELLENLKAAKQKNTDEALSFDSCSNSLQKQLLSLRRAHRAMIKFSENGRVAEVAARKQTEVEFQNFQTRKYESTVCKSAAGRCRFLATPELEQLRPLIGGFQEKEGDSKIPEAEKARLLTGIIEKELEERISLEEKLKALDAERHSEQQKLTSRVSLGAQLSSKMSHFKRALEPLCSLLRGDEKSEVKDASTAETNSKPAEEPPAKRRREEL